MAYAGRLSREKGLDVLPEISQSLRAHGQPHRLLFIGDGPMRAELQAACPGAIFTGRVAHEHVPALLASADLFWFPSRTDTFGNVVLEAQACGLPVIVTDEGGPREAVRHGETGLICGSQGPFTLAVALSWMLREPATAGADGSRRAASRRGAELASSARAAVRGLARGARWRCRRAAVRRHARGVGAGADGIRSRCAGEIGRWAVTARRARPIGTA